MPAAHQGLDQRGGPGWGAQVMSQSGCGGGYQASKAASGGERSPRPVTLQATRVPAGLGPHSLTPTTLFVTLQRISCNIFLPAEIKQSEVRVISSSHLQDAKDNNPQSHPHFQLRKVAALDSVMCGVCAHQSSHTCPEALINLSKLVNKNLLQCGHISRL